MDLNEYYNKLQELANNAATEIAKAACVPAANEMLAETKNRIVRDGKNSKQSDIGQYSTKSAYFGKEAFDKKSSFKAKGKNGNTDRKTMYLPKGYKELRDIQGKPTESINVNYTGSTMNAYQMQVTDTAVLQGFTTELSSKIRKGQEAKRGDIYNPSQKELEDYEKNVIENTKELIAKAFK